MDEDLNPQLLTSIINSIEVGVFVINKDMEVQLWNPFMESHSSRSAKEIIGKNLFDSFPELPRKWLERKISNVFILNNFSFTSWEQRPYLFKFPHNRPVTGGVDCMRQNFTFFPIKNDTGEVEHVCITLHDVTDVSIYAEILSETMLNLEKASITDGLTEVYNRRHLEESLSKEFNRVKRYGMPLSFIIIDLDHFKKVNDTYGHMAGDEVLKITTKRLLKCLRDVDTLGRYGGEEFAIILPETDLNGAEVVAQRICKVISEQSYDVDKHSFPITISVGVSRFRTQQDKYETIIVEADDALYQSKENGRNQFTIYEK
jgi:diguanylate cyclase (GGDEF)-like protein